MDIHRDGAILAFRWGRKVSRVRKVMIGVEGRCKVDGKQDISIT